MRININRIPKSTAIKHTSSQKNLIKLKHTSYGSDLWISWGIVEQANSENNTIDVRLEQRGWILRKVPVRSLEWAGSNIDRGFGERDLPPKDSKVLLVFPDGIVDNAFALCSVLLTTADTGVKLKQELLVVGKEREYLKILEDGWKITRDKDTGDFTIESPEVTDKIIINLDRTNKKVKVSVGNIDLEITNAQVNIAGSTKSLVTHAELDSALQGLITALNNHLHTGVTTGAGSSGPPAAPMSLDISASEAQKAKTS